MSNAKHVGNDAKKGVIQGGILAERVTPTQDASHSKTNQTADGQSANEAEIRHGGGNVDVFPPAFQSWVMFDRRGGNHAKRRDISV